MCLKSLSLIFLLLGFGCLTFGQKPIEGEFVGKSMRRFQNLVLNTDSTFDYSYHDRFACLISGNVKGKWKKEGKYIKLDSEFQLKQCSVDEKTVDEKSVFVEVVNLNNEPVWEYMNVFINNDTTEIYNLVPTESHHSGNHSSCMMFYSDSVEKVTIASNFDIVFEYCVKKKNVNYLMIKGNFSNSWSYVYFDDVYFKARRNRIIGNDEFGVLRRNTKFHRMKYSVGVQIKKGWYHTGGSLFFKIRRLFQ